MDPLFLCAGCRLHGRGGVEPSIAVGPYATSSDLSRREVREAGRTQAKEYHFWSKHISRFASTVSLEVYSFTSERSG